MFPVLAKAGAWGRLAPPKECQVKLARLTDLHFLGCLPKPLSPSAFTLITPGPLPLFILPLHWTSIGLEQGPRTSRDLEFWNSVRLWSSTF